MEFDGVFGDDFIEEEDDFVPGEEEPTIEENIIENTETGNRIIGLGKDNFSKLLSVMSMISKVSSDLSIKNGTVSQLSDKKSSIISINLQSIIGNSDILMNRLSIKTDLLIPFKTQQVEVDLEIEEENLQAYTFFDTYSKLKFNKPLERFLTNQFLPDEEVEAKLNLDEGGYIFKDTLSKFLVERLAAFSKGLEVHEMNLEFGNGKAKFKISTKDGTSSSILYTVENLHRDLTGICSFPIAPFLLVEKMDVSCFLRKTKNENDQKSLFLKIKSEVEEVEVNIWVLAFLD